MTRAVNLDANEGATVYAAVAVRAGGGEAPRFAAQPRSAPWRSLIAARCRYAPSTYAALSESVLVVVIVKNARQNARASWSDPNDPGKAGQYFSVLNCASLYGLSLLTFGVNAI